MRNVKSKDLTLLAHVTLLAHDGKPAVRQLRSGARSRDPAKIILTEGNNSQLRPDPRWPCETLKLIEAGRLHAPTLIIWGADDRSSPMKLGLELLRVIGAVVPRTEFHAFNQAGHYVLREHAPQVNQLITNFVQSL
jgi:pimeloyl-ACP methyl ester carboxylesterase